MTVECPIPDPQSGVAVQLSRYLDCQAHALGENGFALLAGSATMTALLSATVTIFVALIGYQFILGSVPSIRQGVGWAIRLGVVLALVSSWPAFETLVYHVAVDAPVELAATLAPATGLSDEGTDERVQVAYDIMRRGRTAAASPQQAAPAGSSTPPAATTPAPTLVFAFLPMPQTASLFVASTVGIRTVLRLIAGLLVALGPLAALCLLFEGSQGLFEGWAGALTGTAVGVLATSLVQAIELALIDSQILAIQVAEAANQADGFDPQALTTLALVFGLLALLVSYAALRIGAGFRLPRHAVVQSASPVRTAAGLVDRQIAAPLAGSVASTSTSTRGRAAAIADAVGTAAARGSSSATRSTLVASTLTRADGRGSEPITRPVPLGAAGRRSTQRRTRSAQRRDAGI